ncbi:unnamed protein product [Blepharisma stoltei]|uniref:Uncharacterized protein n=1 Tax=Blepharisma stoltei TaxID=1481888 RepID=A0AAU9KJB0_9CILI|nr:unnamed protein product [Blepharisma stoltei]
MLNYFLLLRGCPNNSDKIIIWTLPGSSNRHNLGMTMPYLPLAQNLPEVVLWYINKKLLWINRNLRF